jgi:hypothetical protein
MSSGSEHYTKESLEWKILAPFAYYIFEAVCHTLCRQPYRIINNFKFKLEKFLQLHGGCMYCDE